MVESQFADAASEAPFFEIAGRKIGPSYPPYIVAELSANHNGELARALAIMVAAKLERMRSSYRPTPRTA